MILLFFQFTYNSEGGRQSLKCDSYKKVSMLNLKFGENIHRFKTLLPFLLENRARAKNAVHIRLLFFNISICFIFSLFRYNFKLFFCELI